MHKKYNNINNPYINYYHDGGIIWDKNLNIFLNLKNNFNSGALDNVINTGSSLLGSALSGDYSSGTGNVMKGVGTLASAIPGGELVGAGFNVVGGLVNRLFGSLVNELAVSNFRNLNSLLLGTILNANTNLDLLSLYADTDLLSVINKKEVGKDGLFSNKVSKLTASLNRDRDYARNTYFSNVGNTVNNMRLDELFGATRLAEGGDLFTNGITAINNGGTHELNPLGGVPMGVDNQGTPNIVEEGELIANDYVYSNRLKVPNKDKLLLGIKDKDITYAKALEKLSKESKERPNDPISLRGLLDILEKLRNSLEELKYKKALERNNPITPNVFDIGGDKRNKMFVIATNGYKFPVDLLYYSTTKSPYIMLKDSYGNLIPAISGNNGYYMYNDWDAFRLDSAALERGISPRVLSEGLEYLDKINTLNKSLLNPVFVTKRYIQPSDLPAVTITPRKTNNTKKLEAVTNLEAVTITPKLTNKTTNKTTSKPKSTLKIISTNIPEFPFGNIEGLGINLPNDLDMSFLQSEHNNPNITLNRINTLSNPSLLINRTEIPNIKILTPNVPNKEYSYVEEDLITPILKASNPFYNPWTDPNNILSEWNPMNNVLTLIEKNTDNSGTPSTSSTKKFDLTKLRYAPVLGAAIGLSKSLFSKPDYSGVDRLLNASYLRGTYTPVSYKPIGDYMQYLPFDRNYYTNILNANTAATRRALANQSTGNRATAMAGLLAADYNALNKLGDLFRLAEEYNLAQRLKVADFNRATNMYNSEMGLKAAMSNLQALMNLRNALYQGIANALLMKDAIDARRGLSMSANLSNLFTSLGNIGIDAYNRNDRDMLINTDTYGTLSLKPLEWSDTDWLDYKKRHSKNNNKYGGKLNKKRGGFTF